MLPLFTERRTYERIFYFRVRSKDRYPVVDAEVKATSTSVAIPCAAIPDGEYLVSLEVNGTAVAHRDTFSFASGSATVGDYTLAYSSYAVTVSTTSNNDVVRLVIEPLKVVATDAFKAAVKKVAPEAPNELPAVAAADKGKFLHTNESTGALEWAEGGSGGGVLVVADTDGTLDKTWQEIHDAMLSGGAVIQVEEAVNTVLKVYNSKGTYVVISAIDDRYEASSTSGYPEM